MPNATAEKHNMLQPSTMISNMTFRYQGHRSGKAKRDSDTSQQEQDLRHDAGDLSARVFIAASPTPLYRPF